MRSHDSVDTFLDFLSDWAQGLRHSLFLFDTHRTPSATARLPINRIYTLFGFSLTACRYLHILSTCYEPVWQILGLQNLCVSKILFNVVYSQNNMLVTAKFVILCSVISQGKVVALDRWVGKWNDLSMTTRLATDCAKNYCNRTLIVKVIVQNVVTCFLWDTVYKNENMII